MRIGLGPVVQINPMKNFLRVLMIIALTVTVLGNAARACTVPEALLDIANMKALTEVLPVTKHSGAVKIRRELIKMLDEATKLLNKGGNQNYYRAAMKVYDYGSDMARLMNRDKVVNPEAQDLYDMSISTIDCIVEIYCPTCTYP